MGFHQPANSDVDVFNAFLYRETDFAPHFHRGCELLIVIKGTQKATVAGKRYEVKEGEALFVGPYGLHSYERSDGSVALVAVFSGAYVEEFSSRHVGETPLKARFPVSPATLGFVLSSFFGSPDSESATEFFRSDKAIRSPENDEYCRFDRVGVPAPDGLTLRACLYALVAAFEKTAVYVKSDRDDEFVYSVVDYVERNFRSDISIATLADALGYSYDYASRLFAARFGMRFSSLVNRYRVEEAAKLIATGNVSATEAAMRSGFNSIRSFNRVFRSMSGRTPTGR